MREALSIRPAQTSEAEALDALDRTCWDDRSTPAPVPPGRGFGVTRPIEDTWVAEVEGVLAGYFLLGRRTTLASNAHVALLRALAVAPAYRRGGVGRALLEVALGESRRRGFRKLTLHVLGWNEPAQRLYASFGFEVEGRMRGEYLLAGAYVDDVCMSCRL